MNILIIAEKPTAAKKIAYSLFQNPKVVKIGNVKYFVFRDFSNTYFVASSIGHLFTLKPLSNSFTYPIFDAEWQLKDGKEYEKYSKIIKMLASNCSQIIIATDYDIEGHVIGFNIWRFLCNQKPVKRMKFSTLTSQELRQAFKNLIEININEVNAGLTRHYLDWIWGINLSRALMHAARKFGIRDVLSIGRVQGPTLKLIYEREKEIENFVPKVFYVLRLYAEINGKILKFEHEKRFENFEEANKIYEKVKNEAFGIISDIEESVYSLNPLPPFDTTDLQEEAYNVYGFKPEYTLEIAEKLYLKGYISYPRSGSQKLKNINPLPILSALMQLNEYKDYIQEILKQGIKITEGKKDDPAHPAIIPTNEIPKYLEEDEKKLYDLIVRRFLVCLSDKALRKSIKIKVNVSEIEFLNTFHFTIKDGWLKIYRKFLDLEETKIENIKRFQKVKILKIKLDKEKTKAPPRYTKASLIRELEKRKLGTKATRHEIILTLYKRGYIRGEKIRITELGKSVVEIMENFCKKILSEELTREFEEKLEKIEEGKEDYKKVIEEAKNTVKQILDEIKEKEMEIGEKIYLSLNKLIIEK